MEPDSWSDRLWPRGVKKTALKLKAWIKETAPSSALRQWYGPDPAKWEIFCQRCAAELDAGGAWRPWAAAARRGPITLVYASRETEYNNARALKRCLEVQLEQQ
jgi:uncharacterized protein YeaO (DUF488 family)